MYPTQKIKDPSPVDFFVCQESSQTGEPAVVPESALLGVVL
jgi:hypothetical protein